MNTNEDDKENDNGVAGGSKETSVDNTLVPSETNTLVPSETNPDEKSDP